MAYEEQVWVNGPGGGTPLVAARLQHMESGIKDASNRIDELEANGGGGGGAVSSVNGQTGAVSLGLSDLDDVNTSGAQVGGVPTITQVSPLQLGLVGTETLRMRASLAGDADAALLATRSAEVLKAWFAFCRSVGAIPWIGELGWPQPGGAQGKRLDDIGDALYSLADAEGVSVHRWSARRTQAEDISIYVSSQGDAGTVDTARSSAAVTELHARLAPSGVYRGINFPVGHGPYSQNAATSTASNVNRGTFGVDYTYGAAADYAYFASRGIKSVRLTFRWERVQPTLNGALDAVEIGRLRDACAAAAASGVSIVLCPKNHGSYYLDVSGTGTRYDLGSPQVPASAFGDFWGRMATAFADVPNVLAFDLCNEPANCTVAAWKDASQQAVTAIRAAGFTRLIIVGGGGAGCSDPTSWLKYNGATSWITDPAANYAFDAHYYPLGTSNAASGIATLVAPLRRSLLRSRGYLTNRIETMLPSAAAQGALASGTLYAACFVCESPMTVSRLEVVSGSSIGSGVTLCRMAIGEVRDDDSIEILGETTASVTLISATFARASLPLVPDRGGATTVALSYGQRYALMFLTVATTPPSLLKIPYTVRELGALTPAESLTRTGLTDIPTPGTVLDRAGMANPSDRLYMAALTT